jgi:DNA polymerase III subunit epsilon
VRQVVLDTETTGLYAHKDDRIVELACLELKNRIPTGRTWHWYFNPRRSINPEAERIHGLSLSFLKDYPPFFEAAEDILNVFGDDKLIAHNSEFDRSFLNAEFKRLPLYPELPQSQFIDTLQLAKKKYPGAKNNLDALCKRFKIDNSQRFRHSAVLDTALLAKVYWKLDQPEQTAMDLGLFKDCEFAPAWVRPEPLPSLLTKQEMIAHTDMIDKLGENAMWRKYQ